MGTIIEAATYAEFHGIPLETVIAKIKDGELKGRLVDDVWYVDQQPTEKKELSQQDGLAGKVGFLLGSGAALYGWFGINIMEYNFRFVSVYSGLTDPALLARNGIPSEFSDGYVQIALVVTTIIAGAIVGLISRTMFGKW